MFFSTVVLDGGSMLLMRPETLLGRIAFSSFFLRTTFHTAWVKRDRVEPTAGPAMSAIPRLRPSFALQQNFVMCQMRTDSPEL
jgi:hypothetical protein